MQPLHKQKELKYRVKYQSLENFRGINPCGNNPYNVTSLEEMGLKKEIKYFDKILIRNFDKLFNTKLKLRKTLE